MKKIIAMLLVLVMALGLVACGGGSDEKVELKVIAAQYGGKTAAGELGLPVKESGLVLPCGATGRWTP